jgi:PII-like signaling protein
VIEDCLKVTSYFGERERIDGSFFSDVLLDTFEEYGVTTSILLRAAGGFGIRHHLRGDQTLSMSEDPSVVAVAVDTRARVAPMLPALAALQQKGMLTVERARLVHDHSTPELLPEQLREATKLTIYVGRHERILRRPAHVAICDLLKQQGVAGASVLVGVDGTSNGDRERARFLGRNRDVPTMVIAIGDGARIQLVLPELVDLLESPMISVERVRVCKRDGHLIARPHSLPARDDRARGLWQKLMVYTSESHLHDGEPIHRGIVRRLRATNASGATSLRGAWGFHGDHPPHGDRVLQLGRRVPVVTVVVDTPDRIARSFDIIDELTQEHGLVTCEMVPAVSHFGAGLAGTGMELASYDF